MITPVLSSRGPTLQSILILGEFVFPTMEGVYYMIWPDFRMPKGPLFYF